MGTCIISISREFGSGGRMIGKQLAAQLGIPCYDRTIILKTAEKSGFRLFEKRTVYDYHYNRYADDYLYFRRYWSGCTLKDQYYGDSPYYGRSTSDKVEKQL